MKTKSVLSLLVMLLALGLTTFSCKKDKTTPANPENPVNPTQNEITGFINGVFTVTPNTQVCFSKGNLQYKASTNTWRFAEQQYDFIGEDNINIASDYDGWIDLFGWGTSGYNHGAVCYQPWSTTLEDENYYAYGDIDKNLSDNTGQADWGYNPIINGGNTENQWRTLRHYEWNYLLNTRATESGIRYAKGTVNGITGLIVVPDNWNDSIYSLYQPNFEDGCYIDNIIDSTEWATKFEVNGVVFLPAAGERAENIYSNGGFGCYWSASTSVDTYASNMEFSESHIDPIVSDNRFAGFSVRLVHTVE